MFLPDAASTGSPLFWLCLAFTLWPVLFLSVILHEAGHAAAGKLAGYHIAAWGVGVSEPAFVYPPLARPGSSRFFFCRRQPFTGLTGAIYPGLFPKPRQAALLLLGGAFTNLLFALLGLLLLPVLSGIGYPIGIAWVGVNALLGVMALVPARSRGTTDGARLLALMSSHDIRLRAPMPEALLIHAPLWRAVGATTALQFEQLSLAACLLELGAVESATTYLQNDAVYPLPSLTAYATLVQGLRQEALGNTPEARKLFARAVVWYEQHGHRAAAYLARFYQANADVSQQEQLYGEMIVENTPALRTHATYRLLLATCATPTLDSAALATAVSRYRSARLAWRSDVQDAIAFTAAAHALQKSGDGVGAEMLQKQAQVAIDQVRFALAYHPALLSTFQRHLERQAAGA